jgi:hypothetical protein
MVPRTGVKSMRRMVGAVAKVFGSFFNKNFSFLPTA